MRIRFPAGHSVSRLLGVALLLSLSLGAADAPRPNVVLIITDDAGYADFGCYGATDLRTPHIDRLARDGVRLTDFYAAPQCTPTRADYAAMLESVDSGVGQILTALADRSLTENTLVIFTNDNGGEWLPRNTPFFHRKGTLWEGGVRLPAIFRWPARLPAGVESSQPG